MAYKQYKLTSSAPGSKGSLLIILSAEEHKFMSTVVDLWNKCNDGLTEPLLGLSPVSDDCNCSKCMAGRSVPLPVPS